MGLGDEILGSGLARGAAKRGVKIAFGESRQKRIIWHHTAPHLIFKNNRNVARPGEEHLPNLEWIAHYPGKRLYCESLPGHPPRRRWIAGTQRRGQLFFDQNELDFAERVAPHDFIIIEPNTKFQAPNKQWGPDKYGAIVRSLTKYGEEVWQFSGSNVVTRQIATPDFRLACAILARAKLYIGPEGGLHHAAAALGVPAIVIFGGFISPAVTGYAEHVNLFNGGDFELGCGQIDRCPHCRRAMEKITVKQVLEESVRRLGELHELRGSRVS